MRFDEIRVRGLEPSDLKPLSTFRCSTGEQWEDAVELQVRGPLPRRYLELPPRFDGRMLLASDDNGELLVLGAHHISPTLLPDVGYTEVIAVSLPRRGTLVTLEDGREISLGEFMFQMIFRQMRQLGRHRRTFARIDQRNTRSLALCDRVGLRDQRPDPHDPGLVQRWGELPR